MRDEITLSHILREPNEFIPSGLCYGEELASKLTQRESFPEKPRILEIGIGLGHVGDSVHHCLTEMGYETSYTMLDICRNMLCGFRKYSDDDSSYVLVQGDATMMPFPDGAPFNVVICNEAIGDFPTVVFERDILTKNLEGDFSGLSLSERDRESYMDAVRAVNEYEIDINDVPGELSFNYGAIRFIEEVSRLEPDVVFISENSCQTRGSNSTRYPKKLNLTTHTEYDIDFDNLCVAARSLGFEVETGYIDEFLGIDPKKRIFNYFMIEYLTRFPEKDVFGKRSEYQKLKSKLEDILYIAISPERLSSIFSECGFSANAAFQEMLDKHSDYMGSITGEKKYLILE